MIEFRQARHTLGNEGQYAHVTQDVFRDGVFIGIVRSVDLLPPPDPEEMDDRVRLQADLDASEAMATTSEWLAFVCVKGACLGRFANREAAAQALMGAHTVS